MKTPARIYVLGALGLAAYGLVRLAPPRRAERPETERRAAEIMAASERRIRECREERGIPPDPGIDINRTGLIVRLLEEAGVERGDAVALGASSSFPGAILAVLSAGAAMDLNILAVCSLGASQWGANDPRFDWLDMYACASRDGGPRAAWLALTIGGEGDVGSDLKPEGRRLITERILRTGEMFFEEPDLARNVGRRMDLYDEAADGKPVKAFINVGGAWANMGTDASVLRVEPGLTRVREIPAVGSRGVLQEMASRGIPVIHVLNVAGLASRYGLPLDPGPFPDAGGRGANAGGTRADDPLALAAGWAYIGIVALVLGAAVISRLYRSGPGRPSDPGSDAGRLSGPRGPGPFPRS